MQLISQPLHLLFELGEKVFKIRLPFVKFTLPLIVKISSMS
jgi:hypothetical protein